MPTAIVQTPGSELDHRLSITIGSDGAVRFEVEYRSRVPDLTSQFSRPVLRRARRMWPTLYELQLRVAAVHMPWWARETVEQHILHHRAAQIEHRMAEVRRWREEREERRRLRRERREARQASKLQRRLDQLAKVKAKLEARQEALTAAQAVRSSREVDTMMPSDTVPARPRSLADEILERPAVSQPERADSLAAYLSQPKDTALSSVMPKRLTLAELILKDSPPLPETLPRITDLSRSR